MKPITPGGAAVKNTTKAKLSKVAPRVRTTLDEKIAKLDSFLIFSSDELARLLDLWHGQPHSRTYANILQIHGTDEEEGEDPLNEAFEYCEKLEKLIDRTSAMECLTSPHKYVREYKAFLRKDEAK